MPTMKAAENAERAAADHVRQAELALADFEEALIESERAAAELRTAKQKALAAGDRDGLASINAAITAADAETANARETIAMQKAVVEDAEKAHEAASRASWQARANHYAEVGRAKRSELVEVAASALAELSRVESLAGSDYSSPRSLLKQAELRSDIITRAEQQLGVL